MKRLIIFFLPILLMTACVDSLDDYNVDQKRPSEVPPVTLFSNALKGLADTLTSPNVNVNNYRLYVQQWATTTYLDEPRYNVTARTVPQAFWQGLYKGVISDLNEARRLLNADEFILPANRDVQLAQIEVVEVMAWAALVNTFGNIPYTESLNPDNVLPKYDDAKTVYDDLLARLDVAIPKFTSPGTPFSDGDLLYEGNKAQWAKFGNSLKLKLAMIIADSDPAKAKTLVAQAAPNVFTSNNDNAAFPYISTPPNYNVIAQNLNPLYSSRQDFVASATLVNPLKELKDPRLPAFFTPNEDGEYVGGAYGFSNTYSAFSHVGDNIIEPDLEGILLDYAEVELLLAEAVERGFITGSAATHYNKGVGASIEYWLDNIGTPAAEITAATTAYLAQPKVAYATAATNWKEKIGFQKWLALYNRGWESWVEWRRLDYPKLLPPTGGNAPAGLAIPVRMIYPINEQTLNGANRESAATAIGGDLVTTKLWWDKF
ncbi:SusD/RagB family nutrient-binding outer membrane lipoprotein [Dyadobacter chenhuakuii]|uniref:SusD/RagB family nutrient-binding outer membrane lipoprotein n=1 Tax=Dyadobacter chenhuakuii TaxID=2909339 RepID=A0A9X1QHS8_9BACT|nr:SusD/RagB family nutrient-binding outer membrane lipoprotein [Dyadobacter chenhuakuii]MCF2500742.1 SusD/RagB family nutrient-binding outer membrane lipoprotein [Dyadobacter chenhuakuii]